MEVEQLYKTVDKTDRFTLIECIVTIVIVSMLIALAIVGYQSFLLKSNRIDAISTLSIIESLEAKYRLSHNAYGSLATVYGVTATPKGYYSLASSNVSTTGYTLTAIALGQQANDTGCTILSIAVTNGVESKKPNGCWN